MQAQHLHISPDAHASCLPRALRLTGSAHIVCLLHPLQLQFPPQLQLLIPMQLPLMCPLSVLTPAAFYAAKSSAVVLLFLPSVMVKIKKLNLSHQNRIKQFNQIRPNQNRVCAI